MTKQYPLDVEPEKLKFLAAPTSLSADGKITVEKDLQPTEPSVPIQSAFPRATLGDSGTKILHGIITEEYNPQLSGIIGIRTYDQMRKSDGTVQAALRACKLPIRRAEWFIKAASDDPAAEEQAEFVRRALFEWIEDMTWDDIVRQALLMLDFGVMLFEKIYGTYEFEGKTYVTLKKLSPRLPQSILMWELENHTFGIQQIRQDGIVAQIPGSKLVIFVNDREGDNWWGTSILRSAYQHWYHKSKYYIIDGMGFERQSLGVPYAKMPLNYTEDDEATAESVLANLRAGEKQFLVFPNTIEVGFLDMGGKSVRDPQQAIDHHSKQILQSMLTQFLELGQASSNHGSRALSQDHSDLFLKALEAVANHFITVVNRDVIRELVDMNYDNVESYPVLDFSGIERYDTAALGTAFSNLVKTGALHPTEDDEQWLRAMIGLPARSQEDIDEESDDEPDEVTLTRPAPDTDPAQEEDNDTDDANSNVDEAAQEVTDQNAKKKSKGKTKTPIVPKKQQPQKASSHEHELPRTFAAGAGFMSWRPLTMAETNVDWADMQAQMDKIENDIKKNGGEVMQTAKAEFMAKAEKAIKEKDLKAIPPLKMHFQKQYKEMLLASLLSAHAFGRRSATNELGKGNGRPQISKQDEMAIAALASAAAAQAATELETQAKIAVVEALRTKQPALQAIGNIDSQLDALITKTTRDDAATMVGGAINAGRAQVFEMNDLYGLQRSEILDKKTCNFCISIDGRVIPQDDAWASYGSFHSNCRGLWVGIMNDEANPPEIDGIPDDVASYYGGSINNITQPKKPMPKPGSLADQYVKKQEAMKQ